MSKHLEKEHSHTTQHTFDGACDVLVVQDGICEQIKEGIQHHLSNVPHCLDLENLRVLIRGSKVSIEYLFHGKKIVLAGDDIVGRDDGQKKLNTYPTLGLIVKKIQDRLEFCRKQVAPVNVEEAVFYDGDFLMKKCGIHMMRNQDQRDWAEFRSNGPTVERIAEPVPGMSLSPRISEIRTRFERRAADNNRSTDIYIALTDDPWICLLYTSPSPRDH